MMKQRLLSFMLVLVLVAYTIVPVASARSSTGSCGENVIWNFEEETGTLTISGIGAMEDYYTFSVRPYESWISQITTLIIEEGVTYLGLFAFRDFTALRQVQIANTVETIYSHAFEGCTALTEIVLPDSVTQIGYNAFMGCTALETVTLSENLRGIGEEEFRDCTSLKEITLPKNLEYLTGEGFYGCTALERVEVDEENPYYISVDGIVFSRDKTSIVCYPAGKDTEYAIPEGIIRVGYGSFAGCYRLQRVTFPSTLLSISDEAFSGCRSLEKIIIPYGVESVQQAFEGCDGLKELWLMNPVCALTHQNGGKALFGLPKDCMVYCFLNSTTIPLAEHFGYNYSIIAPYCTDDHDWDGAMTVREPTCLKDGSHVTFCTICGKTKETILPKVPHDFRLFEIESQPTCTQGGRGIFLCGYSLWDGCVEAPREESLPALGHSYRNGVCTLCSATTSGYFADVQENEWYADAVQYVAMNGLFNGVREDTFNPEGTMTRAMLVTVLWRADGRVGEGNNSFQDVHYNSWFTVPILWANTNNIVNGKGGGKFDPDGNITREQIAVILYRYANYKGYDTTNREELNTFADHTKVSAWALDAMQWAVAEGLINGSGGKLIPLNHATRAQVATIMMRFMEKFS